MLSLKNRKHVPLLQLLGHGRAAVTVPLLLGDRPLTSGWEPLSERELDTRSRVTRRLQRRNFPATQASGSDLGLLVGLSLVCPAVGESVASGREGG